MPDAMQSVADWKAATKNKPEDGSRVKIEFLLRNYHRKKAGEMEERLRLLGEVRDICAQYKQSNDLSAPLYAAFMQLGMQADKQLTVSRNAKGGLDKLRKVFGPAKNAHGATKTLQHYGQGKVTPTSQGNYWLEGLDPKHRSWGHMDPKIFDDWVNDAATTKNFWDWLEEKKLADVPGVQYLAPNERWKFMCVFGDDKIIYRHEDVLGGRGKGSIPLQRFTTFGLSTAHSGQNFAIWVCSPGGIFYTNTHAVSKFHHSTFLAGSRVLAAGEWVVAAGKILLISHKTGHHAASPANLHRALKLLANRVDLSRTVVMVVDYAKKLTTYVTATDFLKNNGDASKCPTIAGNVAGFARNRCNAHVDWEGKHATKPRAFPG